MTLINISILHLKGLEKCLQEEKLKHLGRAARTFYYI